MEYNELTRKFVDDLDLKDFEREVRSVYMPKTYYKFMQMNQYYNLESIVNINVIVPNKVTEVTFADGYKEKMVCAEEDTFNLRNCLFIAIAKRKYKKTHTQEGIEWEAFQLTHLKEYVKIVDKALKNYENEQEQIKKLKEENKAEQERIERKRAKRLAYKQRRADRKANEEKQRQIEIQKEAYIQAMEVIQWNKIKEGEL